MNKNKKFLVSILLGCIFFSIGLIVLPHYGPNWDEPLHFSRGQVILHYFLTGKKDYKDLKPYVKYVQKDDTIFFSPQNLSKENVPTRSDYQYDGETFEYFLKDYGHPPVSDILSALFNVILFQKLRLINDVDSYHIYSLLLSAVLVSVIFWWTSKYWGFFVGIIASLSLSLYPLLLGESHNNIKDVPETVFYSLTLIFFYEGFIKKKILLIIASSIFLGLAFSTKFNALFIPFTIVPWFLLFTVSRKKEIGKYFRLSPFLLFYPLFAISIFYFSWPYLWSSPLKNFLNVVYYYTSIGTNSNFDSRFITFFGLNTYAIKWIIYSTPLITLVLSLIGILYAFLNGFREKDKTLFFLLLWFLIPIARVTRPDAGIYGGVRQIMEFVAPMAILSGLGAVTLREGILKIIGKFSFGNRQRLKLNILLLLFFLPIAIKLILIHPNEEVYFNPLVGGLRGAKEQDIPEWGQSLGNPNKQAIQWLNKNAENGAKLATNFGLASSIPTIFLRSDIKFTNVYRSVLERNGEYVIGLTHQSGFEETYFFQYLDKFLDPVYEVRVDEVPILRVWKNDLQNTKEKYKDIVLLSGGPKVSVREDSLAIDVGEKVNLAKMIIKFKISNCLTSGKINYSVDSSGSNVLDEGTIEVSSDNQNWTVLDGDLRAQSFLPTTTRQENGDFVYYFAAIEARYIRISYNPQNLCFKDIGDISIYKLKN